MWACFADTQHLGQHVAQLSGKHGIHKMKAAVPVAPQAAAVGGWMGRWMLMSSLRDNGKSLDIIMGIVQGMHTSVPAPGLCGHAYRAAERVAAAGLSFEFAYTDPLI